MGTPSPSGLSRTIRAASRVVRRGTLARLVRYAGLSLTVAFGLAVVLVGADKWFGWRLSWVFIAGSGAAGLIVAVGLAIVTRWRLARAALEIDRSHGLKDRLSSAIEFERGALRAQEGQERRPAPDPFVAWSLAEAERAASSVKPSRAVPVRLGRSWIAWPVLGASAVLVTMLVPWHVRAPEADGQAAAQPASASESVIEEVRETAEMVREATRSAAVDDLGAQRELESIAELEEQLTSGRIDDQQARARAAEAASNVADRLEREAREQSVRESTLRDRLRGLEQSEPSSGSAEAQRLSRALADGDFEEAARAASKLAERSDELTPEQRERLARDLRSLAEHLEPSEGERGSQESERAGGSEGGPDAGEGTDPRLAERLEQQGVPEPLARELASETDPREIEQKLRESGVDPATASELSERLARENAERRAREQAARDAQELRDALEQSARDFEQPESPGDGQPRPPGDAQPPETGDPPEPSQPQGQPREEGPGSEGGQQQPQPGEGQQPTPSEGQQPTPGGQEQPTPSEGQQPTPGGQQQPTPGGQQQPTPGGQQQPTPGEGQQPTPGEGQQPTPGGQQQPTPGGQQQPTPGGQEQPTPGGQQQPTPGGQQQPTPGEGQQPTPGGQQQPTPGGQQQPTPGGQQPTPGGQQPTPGGQQPTPGGQQPTPGGQQPTPGGDQPGAGSPGLRRLQEQLRERGESGERARENRERARELRERADRLLGEEGSGRGEGVSEGRAAEELARDDASPPSEFDPARLGDRETETVDARSTGDERAPAGERVIAEWYSEGEDGPSGVSRSRIAREQVREARRAAERAIEQQAVPRRYEDVVRRVFDRLGKRDDGREEPSASEGGGEGDK